MQPLTCVSFSEQKMWSSYI